ncbi:MAG: protein kinase [Gemmatimonadota bacterium]
MSDLLARVREALTSNFEVEEEIGRGGMARVFRARDRKHGRQVALKVLEPRIAVTLGADRFLREIAIASRLQHPNIVPLYDSGADGGLLWYSMPLVEGESLQQRIDRLGALPVDDAIRITREVAGALEYAHAKGVVHRDIKPGNIMLSGDVAVVTDFGVARAVDQAAEERLTATGLAIGSVSYMSPEQWDGRAELDGRSDVYSLGCVLYEMLTGSPPFRAGTSGGFMAKHLAEPPPALTGTKGAVPYPAERALFAALEKDPDRRFDGAAAFSEALVRAPGWRGIAMDAATDLWRRRVPHFMAAYLVATWAAVFLARGLADRLMLSPDVPALVLTGMIALLPSVGIIGFFHGGTGRAWPPVERAGVVLNAVGAAALLFLLFAGRNLGPIAQPEPYVDSGGTERVEWVPAAGQVRRVAMFFLENRSGDPDLDWVSYAVPLALDADLEQDLLVLTRTGMVEELRERGDERRTSVPAALQRELAREADLGWTYGGWFDGRADSLVVRSILTRLDARSLPGPDPVTRESLTDLDGIVDLADSLGAALKSDLGLPSGYIERVADRPASEILTDSPKAFRAYVEGKRLLEVEGDPGAASEALREAVGIDADFALAWNALSLAALTDGDSETALAAKRKVIDLDYRLPRWKYLSLLQGYYTMSGEPARALAVAEERVARYPDDLEAHRSLAQLHRNAGRVDDATAEWELLYQREPDRPVYLLEIARARASSSDVRAAREAFERYMASDAASREGRLEYASFLRSRGELDLAAAVYGEALLLDPSDALLHLGVAEVHAARGNWSDAERAFRDARSNAASAAQRAAIFGAEADFRLSLGELEAARRAEEAARRERKAFANPIQVTVDALEGMDRVAPSIGMAAALREVEALSSDLPVVFQPVSAFGRWKTFRSLRMGDSLLVALDDAEEATALLGIELRGDFTQSRADAERWRGNCRGAASLYREALEGGPSLNYQEALDVDEVSAWTGLSFAHLACGDPDAALAAADSARSRVSGSPLAALARAEALAAADRTVEARAALQPALAAWGGADAGFAPALQARDLERELSARAP